MAADPSSPPHAQVTDDADAAVLGLTPQLMAAPAVAPSIQARVESSVRVAELERELSTWREKATALDTLVFEMRALLQSGKGFSEILNIEALLAAFMSVCRERYGAVNSTVLLLDDLDPDNVFYRVRAHHGLPHTYTDGSGEDEELLLFRVPRDEGLLWQLIKQGDVFSVRDMQKRPRFRTAYRRWQLDTLQADVWVPLIRGGEVLGILTLGETEDGEQIPESEFAFLQEIAAVAATNIDSTLKYEKNERILRNLRTLYDVNQQLSNVNDFKRLTIDTLDAAVRALSAQKANLMLYDADTELLEIKVVSGNIPRSVCDRINSGAMKTKAFRLGEGVSGTAALRKEPVRINDRARIEQVGRNVVYCIMAAPLLYAGQVMGVMTLTNKVKRGDGEHAVLDPLGRFGSDDEQLLLALADQAAANLHKARLYTDAITDRVTGLFNTRHFEATVEDELSRVRKTGSSLVLAISDIDRFKQFNDVHGHKAGDEVLVRTAQVLASMVREGTLDGAFRYGGEEFCLLLPDTSLDHAEAILEDYRRRVAAMEVPYEGKSLRVTVSVGLAEADGELATRNQLFEAADRALYAAKHGGRNRIARHAGSGPVVVAPGDALAA